MKKNDFVTPEAAVGLVLGGVLMWIVIVIIYKAAGFWCCWL